MRGRKRSRAASGSDPTGVGEKPSCPYVEVIGGQVGIAQVGDILQRGDSLSLIFLVPEKVYAQLQADLDAHEDGDVRGTVEASVRGSRWAFVRGDDGRIRNVYASGAIVYGPKQYAALTQRGCWVETRSVRARTRARCVPHSLTVALMPHSHLPLSPVKNQLSSASKQAST